jgi:integrase
MAEGQPRRRYVDTRTRYQGVFARHRLNCDLGVGKKRCTCTPSYYGSVWDREAGRHRKTEHRASIAEARNLRADLQAQVRDGSVVERRPSVRFEDAHQQFIAAAHEGIALNKQGKPYRPKAILNLDSSLKRLPASTRRKDLSGVTRGELQRAVDDFRRTGLSSSRIRSIINAVRSLYRWAEDRDLVADNPSARIRLPADDSRERDRVATPGEFAQLLAPLETEDALPFALAAYGTARSQEIRHLEWPEIDFEHRVMLLAGDDEARKSEAARRIVPLARPLEQLLRKEWISQGRPEKGRVCPPRKHAASGLISLDMLQKRVRKRWTDGGLNPIGLHDSRHTAATWLDHAGVSPKVASKFMGHKAPKLQPGAAPITLRRYTHVLDGELERARDQLDAFLAERERIAPFQWTRT